MKPNVGRLVIAENRYWTILLSILVIGFGLKLIRLDLPKDFYFDEVYHAFTAQYYVDGSKDAYNMYYKNPPGRAIEWTHPPLAKLLMAGAMLIAGEDSFGWRLSSVIFGTLLIFFAAMLSRELFENEIASILTAFLLSVEGLIFAQSRIAMNDAHLMCFVFMSLYFYVRWRKDQENTKLMIYSGLGLGLALACKWSALFVYFIIGLERLVAWQKGDRVLTFKKEFLYLTVSFVAIPPVLYLLSYAHFFYDGWNWDDLVRMQQSMWWYHTHLTASHPYKSVPYQWLFNLKPVWMYVDYSVPEHIGNIYNTGNSVVLYGGLACVVYAMSSLVPVKTMRFIVLLALLYTCAQDIADFAQDLVYSEIAFGDKLSKFVAALAVDVGRASVGFLAMSFLYYFYMLLKKKSYDWRIWFCLAAYFMVWLPWVYSPRIMLFYHYAPAVPTLCILLGINLEKLWGQGRKQTVSLVLAAACIWFIVFYPNITGIPVPQWFANAVYFGIPSWK